MRALSWRFLALPVTKLMYSVKWYDKMPMHYADGLHITALRMCAECVADV
jgi:hypothetical protein